MSVKVKDLMEAAVIVAGHEDTLGEVREKMTTYHIGAVPVVDPDGTLVGIITATDLVTSFPATIPVSRVMAHKVHTVIAGILSSFDLLRLIEEGKDG